MFLFLFAFNNHYELPMFCFIRCMLHNFAGNIEMYGILDSIAFGPVEARTSENTTMASLFNVYCSTIS